MNYSFFRAFLLHYSMTGNNRQLAYDFHHFNALLDVDSLVWKTTFLIIIVL